ncbi:hypothetical protein GCM10023192_88420 [Amycolatopsis samaneae]
MVMHPGYGGDPFAQFRANIDDLADTYTTLLREHGNADHATLCLLATVPPEDKNWFSVTLAFAIAELAQHRLHTEPSGARFD